MDQDGVARATDKLLVRYIFPAWLAAGLFDWYWHRQTRIERTAGVPESLMHLVMGLEGGCAFTFALLFEATPASCGVTFAAALIHQLTTIWDVGYTVSRREIKPREQHTHSFMEVLPFCVAALMSVRPQAAGKAFRLRGELPPARAIVTMYAIAVLFGLAPHAEELARCVRAQSFSDDGEDA